MYVKYLIVDSALETWCFPLNYSVQIFFCFFKLSLGDRRTSLSCIRARLLSVPWVIKVPNHKLKNAR